MSLGSLEMLDRALTLALNLSELPFDLNLWQAQNIWYEILKTSSDALTALNPDDRQRWDEHFGGLGTCLKIDCASITAEDAAVAVPTD